MSDDNDHGHGSSPAAWTTVIIMMIGVTAGTWFFWLDMPALVWLSATSLIIGPVVGSIMAKAGYGVGGSKNSVSH